MTSLPEFSWQSLTIRWNPPEGSAVIQYTEGDATLGGILTLRGFTPENSRVHHCGFVRDESLPAGTMVVEPRHV